jgi:hypothetical protein
MNRVKTAGWLKLVMVYQYTDQGKSVDWYARAEGIINAHVNEMSA